MKKIGERLAKLRKEHGYKQTDIAEKLCVSQQVISNIERGVTAPDIEQLKSIADIYSISLDQLVGREFHDNKISELEQKVLDYFQHMDEKEKNLSLGLVSQVVQHRGDKNGKE